MNFLIGLFVLTNAGIFFSRPIAPPRILNMNKNGYIAAIVAMCLIFACIVTGMKLIPALDDQDGEHQGTAYGLMHELKPYFTGRLMAGRMWSNALKTLVRTSTLI